MAPIVAVLFVLLLIGMFLVSRLWVSSGLRVTIRDYEVGLLYVDGKLTRSLTPGGHWLLRPHLKVIILDLRTRIVTVPAQEVLSSDNVSVKASVLLRYRIANPKLATNASVAFADAIYADTQLALREVVGSLPVEELVAKRDTLGVALDERLRPRAAALGLELEGVGIKDLIFPPQLRQVFHQVVEARKASAASLERARGETATLRSLANAARMLENNPGLLALKTLQTAAEGRHTLVLGGLSNVVPLPASARRGAPPASQSPPSSEENDGEDSV